MNKKAYINTPSGLQHSRRCGLMRCMGGRLLSDYHKIENFTEPYLCWMGDLDVM